LYPYAIAVVYGLFGSKPFVVVLLQSFLGVISAALAFLIADRLYGRPVALIAGTLLALYPLCLYYEALLLRASVMAFLVLLMLHQLLRAHEKDRSVAWLTAGAALGLAAICRSSMLAFAPFAVLWMWLNRRPGNRSFLPAVAPFLCGAALVIAPVTAVNFVKSGTFVLVESSGAYNWRIANSYDSTGAYLHPHLMRGDLIPVLSSDFVTWQLAKAWRFINEYEFPNNANFYVFAEGLGTLRALPLSFAAIFCLACLGLTRSPRGWREASLLWFFLLAYSVATILFLPISRLRHPMIGVLVILAANGFWCIVEAIRAGRWARVLGLVAAALVVHQVSSMEIRGWSDARERLHVLHLRNVLLAAEMGGDLEGARESLGRLKMLVQSLPAREQRQWLMQIHRIEARFGAHR
jgi:4-amino-4-deoxy-L-arabinose transferase-like glycosyltransferase